MKKFMKKSFLVIGMMALALPITKYIQGIDGLMPSMQAMYHNEGMVQMMAGNYIMNLPKLGFISNPILSAVMMLESFSFLGIAKLYSNILNTKKFKELKKEIKKEEEQTTTALFDKLKEDSKWKYLQLKQDDNKKEWVFGFGCV
jgi:hypothetical protein